LLDILNINSDKIINNNNNNNNNKNNNNMTTAKNKNIDPIDAPKNSFRFLLTELMTNLDVNLKRCSAELLFILCDENGFIFIIYIYIIIIIINY
jgi:hypothetical protein